MTLALFNPVGFAAHQNGIVVGTQEQNQLCANSGHNKQFNGHAGQLAAVRSCEGECLLVQRPLVFFCRRRTRDGTRGGQIIGHRRVGVVPSAAVSREVVQHVAAAAATVGRYLRCSVRWDGCTLSWRRPSAFLRPSTAWRRRRPQKTIEATTWERRRGAVQQRQSKPRLK